MRWIRRPVLFSSTGEDEQEYAYSLKSAPQANADRLRISVGSHFQFYGQFVHLYAVYILTVYDKQR